MFPRCCPGALWSGLLMLLVAGGFLLALQAVRAQDDQASADPPAAESSESGAPESEEKAAAGEASGAASSAGDPAADHADPAEHAGEDHAAAGHGGGDHGGGDHGGGAHLEGDLSHNNAGPNQEAVIDLRADLAIFTAIVFLLLLAILGKFAWGPIVAGLQKRESAIEHMINEAKENAEKATAQLKAYEAQLAAAAEETREMLAKAHRDADAARERILAEAEQAAQRHRDRAVADIQAAKNVALGEVAQKGADIAVSLAGQIVRRELRPEDHAQLIQDSLERFPGNNPSNN